MFCLQLDCSLLLFWFTLVDWCCFGVVCCCLVCCFILHLSCLPVDFEFRCVLPCVWICLVDLWLLLFLGCLGLYYFLGCLIVWFMFVLFGFECVWLRGVYGLACDWMWFDLVCFVEICLTTLIWFYFGLLILCFVVWCICFVFFV